MLAKVNLSAITNSPIFLSAEEFEKQFTKVAGDRTYVLNKSAIWWAKNGRIGSRWQVGKDTYVRVREAGDDPIKYLALSGAI